MKQKNRECTIVRDLFDVYIEHLTYEETNDFIEEHIKKCTECREALKNFQQEEKEEIQQEEEIRYLKRLRRKIILIYFTVYVIAIIIILGVIYFAIRH